MDETNQEDVGFVPDEFNKDAFVAQTPQKHILSDEAYTLASQGIGAPGKSLYVSSSLLAARQMRDTDLHKFPLLPSAVYTFIQIASSREWTVTGKLTPAGRAVEKLNRAVYLDEYGVPHVGWQEFLQRQVLDWLVIGYSTMLVPILKRTARTKKYGAINYTDPTQISLRSFKQRSSYIVRDHKKVPHSRAYYYDNKAWFDDEILFNRAIPTGNAYRPLGPVFALIPTAMLLYLIREHDTAAADGRKLRDIFITYDDNMRTALQQAVEASVAMWSNDSSNQGLAVVSANIMGGVTAQVRMADLIHRMGLSEIPEGLDREALWMRAANEISGTLGLPLRVWFEDPRGTNRSLERVNQERSRVKGPAFFNRSMERMINNSGILGNVRFGFKEEQDLSLERIRADVVETWAKALNYLYNTFGGVVDLSVFWQLLQRNGLVFDDAFLSQQLVMLDESPVSSDQLLGGEESTPTIPEGSYNGPQQQKLETQLEVALANKEVNEQQSDENVAKYAPRVRLTTARDKLLAALVDSTMKRYEETIPDYGEVVVDGSGNVLDVRRKMFTVNEAMKMKVASEYSPAELPTVDTVAEMWNGILGNVRGEDNVEA
jgi:hypothetical protein